jgi:hypothetical protein
VILTCTLAGLIGFTQVFLVNLQARQVNHKGVPHRHVFFVSIGISGIWSLGVHSVAASWIAVPFYTVGAALGSVLAYKVKLRGGGLN